MVIEFIKLIGPFAKDMIIGRNSLRYALQRNKVKVFFFMMVIASFSSNLIVIPRLWSISKSHVELSKRLAACEDNSTCVNVDPATTEAQTKEIIRLSLENSTLKRRLETSVILPADPVPPVRNKPKIIYQPVIKPKEYNPDKLYRKLVNGNPIESGVTP